MKSFALAMFLLIATGCPGSTTSTGDDMQQIDAATAHIDAAVDSPAAATCPLAASIANTGAVTAFKANRCSVPGSMGAQKWYRLSALVPGTTNDYIQLDLWPAHGAYTGAVTTGSHSISGADATYANCGVCGRALGDKAAGSAKEYFATSGTVNVTAVGGAGQPLSATLSNLTLVEVDMTNRNPVASGCTATLVGAQISGTIVDVGGGGGGGGGCPATVGD